MSLNIKIKSYFAKSLFGSGIVENIIQKRSGTKYIILMYHRVLPVGKKVNWLQEGMYVDEITFDMHIRYLKNHFKILPFSDIIKHSDSFSIHKEEKLPVCFLTFDDGWHDFYKHAYPILGEHGVPATVFLPTNFIGTSNQFWTDQIAYFFSKEDNIERNENTKRPANNLASDLMRLQGPTKSKIERAISILKGYNEKEIYNTLNELKNVWTPDSNPEDRSFLNWEEVREMADSGLINFGSHTNSHRMLTFLNPMEIWEELIHSKNILLREKVVDRSFIPFSYPNGDYNSSVEKLVEKAGYHAAVTTENRWNKKGGLLFGLQRVPIHQDMASTTALFACRITNLL